MSRRDLTVQIYEQRLTEAGGRRWPRPADARRVPELSFASRSSRHSLSSRGEVVEAEVDTEEPNGREPMPRKKSSAQGDLIIHN